MVFKKINDSKTSVELSFFFFFQKKLSYDFKCFSGMDTGPKIPEFGIFVHISCLQTFEYRDLQNNSSNAVQIR